MILGIVLVFIIIIIGIIKVLYTIKENNKNNHDDLEENTLINNVSQDISSKENKISK